MKNYLFFIFIFFLVFSSFDVSAGREEFYSRGCNIYLEGVQSRSSLQWQDCGRYEIDDCRGDDLIVGIGEAFDYNCPAHEGQCIYFKNNNDAQCNNDFNDCENDQQCSPQYHCERRILGNRCVPNEDDFECENDQDCGFGETCNFVGGGSECVTEHCPPDMVWNDDNKRCDFGNEGVEGDSCVFNQDCSEDEFCSPDTHECQSYGSVVGSGELCNLYPDLSPSPIICSGSLGCVSTEGLTNRGGECSYDNVLPENQLGVCSSPCPFGYELPPESDSCLSVQCKSLFSSGSSQLDQCLSQCGGNDFQVLPGILGIFEQRWEKACSNECYNTYGNSFTKFFHSLGSLWPLFLIILSFAIFMFFPISRGLLSFVFNRPLLLIIIVFLILIWLFSKGVI